MRVVELEWSTGSERQVVERCINSEGDAWECLFRRYQPRLLAIIRNYLGDRAGCGDLDPDEIAASVWYSLVVRGNARLRRYDPSRGARLLTYLAALARREIWKQYRREQSRRAREARASRPEAAAGGDPRCDLLLREFLAMLTRREREFCLHYLLSARDGPGRPEVSACNTWQLRSRILHKFRIFLSG